MPLPSPPERTKLRKDMMGLTLREAASEIGVTARTLWRWEHGEDPNPKNHRKYQVTLQRWRQIIDSAAI